MYVHVSSHHFVSTETEVNSGLKVSNEQCLSKQAVRAWREDGWENGRREGDKMEGEWGRRQMCRKWEREEMNWSFRLTKTWRTNTLEGENSQTIKPLENGIYSSL